MHGPARGHSNHYTGGVVFLGVYGGYILLLLLLLHLSKNTKGGVLSGCLRGFLGTLGCVVSALVTVGVFVGRALGWVVSGRDGSWRLVGAVPKWQRVSASGAKWTRAVSALIIRRSQVRTLEGASNRRRS